MNYRLLGRSGLRVSDVGLGTMTFGATTGWGVSAETARGLYESYRQAGGNYIDTANQYAGGRSEEIVADLVTGHREEVVIASKYTNSAPRNGDANAGGNHRKNMVQSIEGTLRRLRTDYVDLYIVHSWDLLTPVDEVMRALDDLVRAGKILYIGVSNTPAWVVAKSNTLAELRGWTCHIGLQIEYHLLGRAAEAEFFPMAADQGLSVLAWSPLKNGILTGKYAMGSGQGSRLATPMWNSSRFDWAAPGDLAESVLPVLFDTAADLDVTPAQLALAWLRHRPIHVVPILGATSIAQMDENLASIEIRLSDEQVNRLDEASAVPLDYPHHYLASPMARSFRSGGLYERISR
ncbi:aldo/keto reductase [Aeromicrobium sp. YIM 150415]|uniref:aldo/keto reductase n=1 Tax=Aeromicrobium sp. YIM 150415 TaxID=2803912 RepID=UPI0019629F38|nr:aldo/keto reductase [Aeromicrobium sp. YIM 150415]MBM9464046.1 aldo/keto reductase [Aeromicrobium sp. YIM 150415]